MLDQKSKNYQNPFTDHKNIVSQSWWFFRKIEDFEDFRTKISQNEMIAVSIDLNLYQI